jgi:hypothetical protein
MDEKMKRFMKIAMRGIHQRQNIFAQIKKSS